MPQGPPLTYDELARFAAAMPKVPRYTLHAHPSVIEALVNIIGPSGERAIADDLQFQPSWNPGDIDVFPEADWAPGAYELRRNGVVILALMLTDPQRFEKRAAAVMDDHDELLRRLED